MAPDASAMFIEQPRDIASSKSWFVDQGFPADVFDRLVNVAGVITFLDLGFCTEDELKTAGLSLLQVRRFVRLQSKQLRGKASAPKLYTQIEELRKAVRSEALPSESGKNIVNAISAKIAQLTGASAHNLAGIEINEWGESKGKEFELAEEVVEAVELKVEDLGNIDRIPMEADEYEDEGSEHDGLRGSVFISAKVQGTRSASMKAKAAAWNKVLSN